MLGHSLGRLVLSSSLSAVWGWCPQWCSLTVSEGVMFQRWIAFPVFIDCFEADLDDTLFRYISGRGRHDGPFGGKEGVEKWGGQTLRHHLAYSLTQSHWSQPQCSLSCFLCFHCAIIGWEQTTTSGGKATDSSVSNVLWSKGRKIYMYYSIMPIIYVWMHYYWWNESSNTYNKCSQNTIILHAHTVQCPRVVVGSGLIGSYIGLHISPESFYLYQIFYF